MRRADSIDLAPPPDVPDIRYPVSQPWLGPRECELLLDAFDSGWISSRGAYVERVTREFPAAVGLTAGVPCTSGTAALHLALLALGAGPGDEIIVPNLSYVATANAPLFVGSTPVLADLSARDWAIDLDEVARLVTPRTRGVIAEHGAVVVARPRRLGIGTVVYVAVAQVSMPVIATMDADMSHPRGILVDAYTRLAEGVDIVRFSRFLPASTWDAPLVRRAGLRVFAAAVARTCGLPLTDPTNGLMLARRECFDGPTRFREDPGEGWVAEFQARNRRRRMVELPYAHAACLSGRSHNTWRHELSRALRSVWLGLGNG
jgi:hypothetical protein